jgi:hypothetical protein
MSCPGVRISRIGLPITNATIVAKAILRKWLIQLSGCIHVAHLNGTARSCYQAIRRRFMPLSFAVWSQIVSKYENNVVFSHIILKYGV